MVANHWFFGESEDVEKEFITAFLIFNGYQKN